MTAPEREPLARGAVAGLMVLSALILCGVVGGVLGAIVGAVGPLLAVGILVGFIIGVMAVRARFPDL